MFIYWRRKCRNDSFLCSFKILIWWYHDIGTIHISNNNNNKHKAYPLNTTFTFPFSKLSSISATCKVLRTNIAFKGFREGCAKRGKGAYLCTHTIGRKMEKGKVLEQCLWKVKSMRLCCWFCDPPTNPSICSHITHFLFFVVVRIDKFPRSKCAMWEFCWQIGCRKFSSFKVWLSRAQI